MGMKVTTSTGRRVRVRRAAGRPVPQPLDRAAADRELKLLMLRKAIEGITVKAWTDEEWEAWLKTINHI